MYNTLSESKNVSSLADQKVSLLQARLCEFCMLYIQYAVLFSKLGCCCVFHVHSYMYFAFINFLSILDISTNFETLHVCTLMYICDRVCENQAFVRKNIFLVDNGFQ